MASKKIGALWKRTSQDGTVFLTGVIQDLRGDIQIVVFQNNRKEKENQPDFNIILSEPKEQEKAKQTGIDPFAGPDVDNSGYSEPLPEDEIKIENIPF